MTALRNLPYFYIFMSLLMNVKGTFTASNTAYSSHVHGYDETQILIQRLVFLLFILHRYVFRIEINVFCARPFLLYRYIVCVSLYRYIFLTAEIGKRECGQPMVNGNLMGRQEDKIK